ncbi:MAG: DUF3343 domain-containing protein [Sphaerochaetaceae bacterium]|mgnify:FL=1|jgi:hypothetical protein|nr:DUF3343 domain-containing protein [Sphaerochaetaceae bacterium]
MVKGKAVAVVTFPSTHYAISAERLLATKACAYTIIPTPSELSHQCGIALQISFDDVQSIGILLKESRIRFLSHRGTIVDNRLYLEENTMLWNENRDYNNR